DTTAASDATGDTTAETPAEKTPDDTRDTTPDTATTKGRGGEGGTDRTDTLRTLQDLTTANARNRVDSPGHSVWNSYFLQRTYAAPYTIQLPGLEVQPWLAEGELPPVTQEGDVWVGEFTLRSDAQWSDGEPITAEDVAFTWATAVEFELTANWEDYADADIVESVEAVDDQTVRVTFNSEPGLAIWGLGNSVPLMPIMPEHFWGP